MNKKVECPKCGAMVDTDISKRADELGEVHFCPKCGMKFT